MTREEVEEIVVAIIMAHKAGQTPPWKDWRVIMGLPAALIATGVVWSTLGFPTFASSTELRRIERQQIEIAIQTYQNALNSLIATTPPEAAPPSQRRAWEQQYEQANRALNRAIEEKINLSK